MESQSISFTELYASGQRGDSKALGLAYGLIFSQLHRIASRLLSREHKGHSLRPTAMIGEIFLRFHQFEARVLNREHFLALASRSMKQHLIDRGRHRSVKQRASHQLTLELTALAHPCSEQQTAVRLAWERLRQHDPLAAEIVWLMKVEGLTIAETANRTRQATWRIVALSDYAIQWMADRLR